MKSNYDPAEKRRIMMEKYRNTSSLEAFMEHEVLELLLDFTMPKSKDTNVIAHDMINKEGSLKNVLNLECSDIIKKYNLSTNTAALISLTKNILKPYLESKFSKKKISFQNREVMLDFIDSFLHTEKDEKTFVIFTDLSLNFIKKVCISYDGLNQVYVKNLALEMNNEPVKYAIIARKTEGPKAQPSSLDLNNLKYIKGFLYYFNVVIYDYIVFLSRTVFFSFKDSKLCDI